jgi:hypothetical protein
MQNQELEKAVNSASTIIALNESAIEEKVQDTQSLDEQ